MKTIITDCYFKAPFYIDLSEIRKIREILWGNRESIVDCEIKKKSFL